MTQKNNNWQNIRIGEEVYGTSISPDDFPAINEMIETSYPKWRAWQKRINPHFKVGKSDYLRFALIRGIIFTDNQVEQEENVAA